MAKKLNPEHEPKANLNYSVKSNPAPSGWGSLGEVPAFSTATPAGSKSSDKFAYRFADPQYTGTPHNPFQVQKDKGKPKS